MILGLKFRARIKELFFTYEISWGTDELFYFQIVINSMQKYRLRLIVTKMGMRHCDQWVFNFSETQFITVTSYQNPRMTQLKIDNNPFAKAFREGKRYVNILLKVSLDVAEKWETIIVHKCSLIRSS